MNTPFFISWRYQRGKQKNPLVALISKFSAIGIALGVAVLIVGLSAMNGFERELNSRILAVVPHTEITVNPHDNEATLNIPVPIQAQTAVDLLNSDNETCENNVLPVQNGRLEIKLKGNWGAVLKIKGEN